VYQVRQGNKDAARKSLEKAKALGFSDNARIRRWPELKGVVSDES
jgi:hypothetical protein